MISWVLLKSLSDGSYRCYLFQIADVWSCGVTLYVMLFGGYPFEDPNQPRDFRKTIHVQETFSLLESDITYIWIISHIYNKFLSWNVPFLSTNMMTYQPFYLTYIYYFFIEVLMCQHNIGGHGVLGPGILFHHLIG